MKKLHLDQKSLLFKGESIQLDPKIGSINNNCRKSKDSSTRAADISEQGQYHVFHHLSYSNKSRPKTTTHMLY
jgi:hypothetical protein